MEANWEYLLVFDIGCTRRGLDWVLGNVLHCYTSEQAAHGSSGVTMPGIIQKECRCGTWRHSLVIDLAKLA